MIRTCSTMLNAQSLAADLFNSMPSIFCFEDDQDQVRHRTEYCSEYLLNPSMLIVCGDKVLLCTFDLV